MNITPRVAITLTFIAFGMIMGGQIGAFPALKIQAGLDSFMFGALATLATLASIAAMSLGGAINKRFDHRSMLLFILPTSLLCLALSLSANSIWLCALTWMAFNFCGGTMDLFMNAEASSVEHDLQKPVFSSFHSAVLYAIGIAGFISGYTTNRFGILFSVLTAAPFVAAAVYAVHQAIPHRTAEQKHEIKTGIPLPIKILVLVGIILGFNVATELACIQWSGQLLNEMRPDLAAYSGLGVGFYGLCSGTTRAFGDRLRATYGDMKIVSVSFAIGLVGFVALSLHPNFALSVMAFAVTGCGLALIFPCMFSIAAHLVPQSRAAALGLASMVSGPPRILLPLLLGWLAQTRGLSTIYVAASAGIAVALVFTYLAARAINQTKGAQVALRPNATN